MRFGESQISWALCVFLEMRPGLAHVKERNRDQGAGNDAYGKDTEHQLPSPPRCQLVISHCESD